MRQRQPEANGSRLCRKMASVQDQRSRSGLLGKGSINNGAGGTARNSLCRWRAQLRGSGRVMYCVCPVPCALCPPVTRLSLKRDPRRRAHLRSSTDSQIRAFTLAFTKNDGTLLAPGMGWMGGDGALPGVRWRLALRCMRTGMSAGHCRGGLARRARPASGC
jgi:hypothetical protein